MKLSDWTDQKVENIIGTLLRVGVLSSAFVVFIGGAIYLTHHSHSIVDYRIFQGEPADYRHIGGIIHEAIQLNGRGIIQLGLLLLIATPIARVIFALFGFAAEKDRMYACFTAIVLVVLLYSLLGTS